MNEKIAFLERVVKNLSIKIKEALNFVKGARKEQQIIRKIIKELKHL